MKNELLLDVISIYNLCSGYDRNAEIYILYLFREVAKKYCSFPHPFGDAPGHLPIRNGGPIITCTTNIQFYQHMHIFIPNICII